MNSTQWFLVVLVVLCAFAAVKVWTGPGTQQPAGDGLVSRAANLLLAKPTSGRGTGAPADTATVDAPGVTDFTSGIARLRQLQQAETQKAAEAGRTKVNDRLRAVELAGEYSKADAMGVWPAWMDGVQYSREALTALIALSVESERRNAGYEAAARRRAEELAVDCRRMEVEFDTVRRTDNPREREEAARRAAAILERNLAVESVTDTDRLVVEKLRRVNAPTVTPAEIAALAAEAAPAVDWDAIPSPAFPAAEPNPGVQTQDWATSTPVVSQPPSPRDARETVAGQQKTMPRNYADFRPMSPGQPGSPLAGGAALPPQCLPAKPDPGLARPAAPSKTPPRRADRLPHTPYRRFFP